MYNRGQLVASGSSASLKPCLPLLTDSILRMPVTATPPPVCPATQRGAVQQASSHRQPLASPLNSGQVGPHPGRLSPPVSLCLEPVSLIFPPVIWVSALLLWPKSCNLHCSHQQLLDYTCPDQWPQNLALVVLPGHGMEQHLIWVPWILQECQFWNVLSSPFLKLL